MYKWVNVSSGTSSVLLLKTQFLVSTKLTRSFYSQKWNSG